MNSIAQNKLLDINNALEKRNENVLKKGNIYISQIKEAAEKKEEIEAYKISVQENKKLIEKQKKFEANQIAEEPKVIPTQKEEDVLNTLEIVKNEANRIENNEQIKKLNSTEDKEITEEIINK